MAPAADAILSIQSQVAYGHVGNSAAMLPLQRLGFEVWPVSTVQLAHHPGYGQWRGYRVEPDRLAAILAGLEAHGALGRCRALLTGYLGEPATAALARSTWQAIRAARPDVLFLCDPVIGDDGPGVFVRPGVAEAIAAELIPAAGIVTPNRFELAHLAGQPVEGLSDALAAAALLRTRGPQLVVATGLPLDGPDGDRLGVLAAATADAWLVATPRLPRPFAGTGDAFSALLLGHLLRDPALPAALERAVSALYALVETTSRLDLAELALVEAQDAFAGGEVRFRAERVS